MEDGVSINLKSSASPSLPLSPWLKLISSRRGPAIRGHRACECRTSCREPGGNAHSDRRSWSAG